MFAQPWMFLALMGDKGQDAERRCKRRPIEYQRCWEKASTDGALLCAGQFTRLIWWSCQDGNEAAEVQISQVTLSRSYRWRNQNLNQVQLQLLPSSHYKRPLGHPLHCNHPGISFATRVLCLATTGWFLLTVSFWSHKGLQALSHELLLSQESRCAGSASSQSWPTSGEGWGLPGHQLQKEGWRNSPQLYLLCPGSFRWLSRAGSHFNLAQSSKQLCGGNGTTPIPILRRIKKGLYCNPPLHRNQSLLLITEGSNASQGSFPPCKQNKTNPSYGFHLPFNAT